MLSLEEYEECRKLVEADGRLMPTYEELKTQSRSFRARNAWERRKWLKRIDEVVAEGAYTGPPVSHIDSYAEAVQRCRRVRLAWQNTPELRACIEELGHDERWYCEQVAGGGYPPILEWAPADFEAAYAEALNTGN